MSPRFAKIAVTAATLALSGGIGLWTATTGFAGETTPAPVGPGSGEEVRRAPKGPGPAGKPIIINPPDDPGVTDPTAPGQPGATDPPLGMCPTCGNPSEAPSAFAPADHAAAR